VRRTAELEGKQANWRPQLFGTQREADKKLLQFCHGAPGFVICLAGFPGDELDELLLAAGETVWAAGPLAKGAYHGQGRYSLRTGDPGFAIYLWDCIRAEAAFPTLDVFQR
jgi:hypothetical protein